jgi:GT2 family glycosyltransferase/SAM-dependent methyltransferase
VDSSGERFVPDVSDAYDEIAMEHLQRYRSILDLVRGKVVLDAGSGEGYGTHLLSRSAASAIGVDVSEEAVAHAAARYAGGALSYRQGSIDALPFPDRMFDVVVCFEVIEHVDEALQKAFLGQARRVLKPDGILVISTPNRAVYTDASRQHNQFHKHEFYVDEFCEFLHQNFPHISLFGQGWFVSSILEKAEFTRLDNLRIADAGPFSPKYVIAVCGPSASIEKIDLSSALVDRSQKLESLHARILTLQTEVDEKNSWVVRLETELETAKCRTGVLQEEVEQKNEWALGLTDDLASANARIVDLQREVEVKNAWALDLDSQIGDLRNLVAELSAAKTELDLIKQSDFWKVATRYWRLRNALLPLGSRRQRIFRRMFGVLKSGASDAEPIASGYVPPVRSWAQKGEKQSLDLKLEASAQPFPVLEFAAAEQPRVSIIIPAFNQWRHTYACLQSIHRTIGSLKHEVILADDGSNDDTVRAGEMVPGVRIMRDGTNRGFLRNCNHAAAQARGEYLYFLNNDAELRAGAIQSLVSLLDSDPGIGIAGSKLIYPNGRIQEAGGIIWADASGWNYGKGQNATLPEFNYVKEVDYVSGASLMISKRLWDEIGGFDEQYAPAYCEDSDLAFEVRRRGRKVVYQPKSVVVHHEGISHGTDVENSMKANQVRNASVLKTKWASVLEKHFPNGQDVFHARDCSAAKKTILIIDHYVPHFDRDAGSRTMGSFIQALQAMGLNVKFLGDNFFAHQPYTEMLEQAGVEILVGPWYADHWPEWLRNHGRYIDYVLLNRPHIAPKYIRPIRSDTSALLLFYVHDLHYLREEQIADIRKDTSLLKSADRMKSGEQKLMHQMDAILSCSDIETAILRELCPSTPVFYVPPYAVSVEEDFEFDISKRQDILFVGGFGHPPNADGILWFVRDVWPLVSSRLPGIHFNIAGSDPPSEIRSLESETVKVLGFVNDARLKKLYDSARLVAIPLRYGAGVKGKTVEAMANGVPFVSTQYGIEGMPGVERILDPAQIGEDMAENILSLYEDDDRLKAISRAGRSYVAGLFNLSKIQSSFEEAFALRTRRADRS